MNLEFQESHQAKTIDTDKNDLNLLSLGSLADRTQKDAATSSDAALGLQTLSFLPEHALLTDNVEKNGVQITDADNGKIISAKVGDDVNISLRANVTTGYRWSLVSVNGKSVAADGAGDYAADPHPPGSFGTVGAFKFHFKAQDAGISTIELKYTRPWETQTGKTFTVKLDVAPKA